MRSQSFTECSVPSLCTPCLCVKKDISMNPRFKMGMESVFRSVCFCFVLSLFFSCSDFPKTTGGNRFNSESYFSAEASRLASKVKTVNKVVGRNSEMDSGQVAITDWKKELEPFSQCNISKPTFRNSYRVDS